MKIYEFSKFRMEAERQILWHDGEIVPLTPKEFEVLLFLVERPGQLADKNEMLEVVWPDTFVEEATLARNISWLRRKLAEFADGENLIETVPKRGYCFTSEVIGSGPDENLVIVEEETTHEFEFEENVSFTDYELPELFRPTNEKNAPETARSLSIFGSAKSLKARYVLIGIMAFLGIGLLIVLLFFNQPAENKDYNSGVFGSSRPVNLALGKPTRQSSNLGKNRGLSYEAVDGNTNGNWFEASVTSTGHEREDEVVVRGTTDPWWEVDLGSVYEIEQIKIYIKTDLRSQYIDNFRVEVKNEPNEEFRPFVEGLFRYEDFGVNPISLRNNTTARYVRIRLIGSGRTLFLAEVEVFGTPRPGENYEIPLDCQPKSNQITLFSEPQFQGKCEILNLRNYPNPESIGAANHEFYSLLVGEDIKAIVCDGLNFQGNCQEVIARRSFEKPILSVKMADYFKLKDAGGNCLEVGPEDSPGIYSVRMKSCAENQNQNWFWSEWGELRVSGDRCLDLSENDKVIVTKCDKRRPLRDRAQRWVWTLSNEIRTATRNKTCLEVTPEGSVGIRGCDFTPNQIWNFMHLP